MRPASHANASKVPPARHEGAETRGCTRSLMVLRSRPTVEFRTLGSVEVVRDGRVVDLGSGRQAALLAILLLHRNDVVSRDRLVDELWGARPPATAAKSVRNAVSLLRKEIGDRIVTRPPGYLLRVEDGELDSDRVEALLREARTKPPGEAAELLREALDLFRGRPFGGLEHETFAQTEIERLEQLRLSCLQARIEVDLILGLDSELLGELEALTREHPFNERFRGQLMLSLYRSGRQADALDAYQQGRRAMTEGLGLEPSRDLQQLERLILNHDVTLEAPTRLVQRSSRHRRGLRLGVAGAGLLLAAAVGAAIVQLGASGTRLSGIAANSVGVIDPSTNRIVAQIPVGAQPTRETAAADAIWVINQGDSTLSRIDYRTESVRTIGAVRTPIDIAAGAGAVWLLSVQLDSAQPDPFAGPSEVTKIDSSSVTPLQSTMTGALAGNELQDAITAAPQGVWVSEPGALVEISPASAAVVKSYKLAAPDPGTDGIVFADGSLWLLNAIGMLRVDPQNGGILATIQVGATPIAVAVDRKGAVWVASSTGLRIGAGGSRQVGRPTLSRVDPGSNTVTSTIPLPANPTGLAAGAGAVWVAEGSQRSILKIDPTTGRIKATLQVKSHPQAVAVAADRLWVASQ